MEGAQLVGTGDDFENFLDFHDVMQHNMIEASMPASGGPLITSPIQIAGFDVLNYRTPIEQQPVQQPQGQVKQQIEQQPAAIHRQQTPVQFNTASGVPAHVQEGRSRSSSVPRAVAGQKRPGSDHSPRETSRQRTAVNTLPPQQISEVLQQLGEKVDKLSARPPISESVQELTETVENMKPGLQRVSDIVFELAGKINVILAYLEAINPTVQS